MTETGALTRHISLDALRGFAVMGILAMNIIGFAMPEWAYLSPSEFGGETLADRISWFLSFVFVEGKMRGLFSLLFGASMMLIIERAEASGQSAAKVHYARMAWLALFGLLHYFLIWYGDILFLYATVGSIAFLMRGWQSRWLINAALIIYGLGFLLWAVQFGGMQYLQWSAGQPGADPDVIRQYHEMMASGGFTGDIAKDLAIHRGSWAGIVADKLQIWYGPLETVGQTIIETLPLMMLGMAFKKNGFLTGGWEEAEYRHWINRLLLPGLLMTAALAAFAWRGNFNIIDMLANFLAWSVIPRLMITVAYAAWLILLIRKMAGNALLARVAATGRAAFTNYLGTSIVMTTIFYGYGLDLYGHVGRPALWLFVIGAWIVMLAWSKPWLDHFHYGPLEWLWRSLARLEMQPFRKSGT